MKTIIRIQHSLSSNGIFRAKNTKEETLLFLHSQNKIIEERHSSADYPSLFADVDLYEQMKTAIGGEYDHAKATKYYFAFNTLAQLEKALTRAEIKEFIQLGFEVLLIEVTNCISSEYQTIFLKEDVVSQKNINELFI